MITITQFKDKYALKSNKLHAAIDAARFREVVGRWHHAVLADKDKANIFTMCRYGSAPNRKQENILAVTGIVLDVDDGNTPEQLVRAFDMLEPFAYCWYTTYSHTEVNPRVRLIVPMSAVVTALDFAGQELALRLAHWLGLTIDECSAKPTQFYYMPTKPMETSDSYIHVGDSTALFDIEVLPATPAKPSSKKSRNSEDKVDIFKMVDALVADMFGGVEPIFVGEKFHMYNAGVWHAVDPGRTFYKAMVDYHNRKMSIKVAMELVFAMKIMFSRDQFPSAQIHKITLNNGTLNTETGELEPHSPENYHRSGMEFDYDAEAKCPLWLATLDALFLPDADAEAKKMLVQEWFGYNLTPMTKYQVMLWLYGGGANGKSVVTRVLRELLGIDNVCSIPLSQLGARFIGAELEGKLANIVDEIATNALMQEDEMKKVVSGDPIMVERKGKDPYFFSPTARITAATNTLPPSKDSTHGLDRRLMIVPCNRTFTPAEMDRSLGDKLVQELPGIFVWALEGQARLRLQDVFTIPPSSLEAMEDFKVCRNSVSLFKRDCLELPKTSLTLVGSGNKTDRIPSHDLYRTYKAYCSANTYQAFAKEGFGKKLKDLGVEQIRTGGKRYYVAKLINLEEAGIATTRFDEPTRITMATVMDDLADAA